MLWRSVLLAFLLLSEGGVARRNCSDEAPGVEAIVEGLVKGFVEGITEELASTKAKLSENSVKLSETAAQLEDVKQKCNLNYTVLNSKLDAANRVVAFHAYHSSDPFSVASQGTIVYNSVTTNIGGGYDRLSGIFTAPVSGTYSFFTNCMARSRTVQLSNIILNGYTTLARCYSSRAIQDHYPEQGATQGIAHLNAGDKVWVRIRENAQDVRGNYWNTFSGFLIRADV